MKSLLLALSGLAVIGLPLASPAQTPSPLDAQAVRDLVESQIGTGMWDRGTWQFVNSFADWLSAVGTIAAVVVSLYLASRDFRIRLKIRAGIRSIVREGQNVADAPVFVNVEITNVGRRAATVTHIAWVRRFMRRGLVQIPSNNPMSARLPLTLTDGDVGNLFMDMTVVEGSEVQSFLSLVGRMPLWLGLRLIRIATYTTTGERVSARIERGLREKIRDGLQSGRAGRAHAVKRYLSVARQLVRRDVFLMLASAVLSALVSWWYYHAALADAEAHHDEMIARYAVAAMSQQCPVHSIEEAETRIQEYLAALKRTREEGKGVEGVVRWESDCRIGVHWSLELQDMLRLRD